MKRRIHRESPVVSLEFPFNKELQEIIRTIPGAAFSKSMRCWYLPDDRGILSKLFGALKGHAWLDYSALLAHEKEEFCAGEAAGKKGRAPVLAAQPGEHNRELIERLRQWMGTKRYSGSSISAYTEALEIFCRWRKGAPLEKTRREDVLAFNEEHIIRNKLSATYQSHFVSALKLLFNVCHFERFDTGDLVRPKKPKRLPNVLSKQEVKQILDAVVNLKHRCMLSLVYSCGLRCGELLSLKPEHVDGERELLIIKSAKGNKDRVAPLSRRTLELIEQYRKWYPTRVFLFEGQRAGERYDERSLQLVLKQSVKKAGIEKPVTLHWLRHSYATHLLEAGTNLRYIQEILGHSNPRTTQIYTHVSTESLRNIISPFDSICSEKMLTWYKPKPQMAFGLRPQTGHLPEMPLRP